MTADRFPGTRVVVSVAILFFTSAGLGFYGLGVYLDAITQERGFSTTAVSGATALFFVVGGLCGIWIARMIARIDVRRILVGGSLLGGIGLALIGQVREVWQVYVAYGFFAVGWSACNVIPGTTVITRWFRVRRSVALAWASTGLSVGGLVLVPITKAMVDRYGLAATTPWLGLAFPLIIVPTALFILLPDPAPLGWLPDGEPSVGEPPPPTGTPFAEAVRTRFWWAVTVGFVLALGAQVGAINHLVKLGRERVDSATGAAAISVLTVGSVLGRLVGGWLASRVSMLWMMLTLVAMQTVAFLVLSRAEARWAILIGAGWFGLTIGNVLMMRALLMAEAFGVRDYPRIASVAESVGTVGIATGPFAMGALHDSVGYDEGFATLAVVSLVAMVVFWFGGPPERAVSRRGPAGTVG